MDEVKAPQEVSELEGKLIKLSWQKCIENMESLLSHKIEGRALTMEQRVGIKSHIKTLTRNLENFEDLTITEISVPSSINFDNRSQEDLMNESLLRKYASSEGKSYSLLESKILEKMRK